MNVNYISRIRRNGSACFRDGYSGRFLLDRVNFRRRLNLSFLLFHEHLSFIQPQRKAKKKARKEER